jgi:hypothetical protein
MNHRSLWQSEANECCDLGQQGVEDFGSDPLRGDTSKVVAHPLTAPSQVPICSEDVVRNSVAWISQEILPLRVRARSDAIPREMDLHTVDRAVKGSRDGPLHGRWVSRCVLEEVLGVGAVRPGLVEMLLRRCHR